MISFSKKVKKELCDTSNKLKNCCGYSLIYGMLFCSEIKDDLCSIKMLNHDVGEYFVEVCQQASVKQSLGYSYENNRIKIASSFLRSFSYKDIKKSVFRCTHCKESFMRGLYLAIGAISDPDKSYRLELIFNEEEKAYQICDAIMELGIEPLKTIRAGKTVVYLRKSEAIEDFFANIGATSLAFDIMNSKINKELINNANRITNCDAANINKALNASNKYITVINDLIKSKKVYSLPEHLQEMALKRIEYKELSFLELGKQFSPPISKSGVYHRLEKIVDFYNELKEKELI